MTDLHARPVVASTRNDRVKRVATLRKPRERRRQGLTVIEGFQMLELAVAGGWTPDEIFATPGRMAAEDFDVLEAGIRAGGRYVEVTADVLTHLSKRDGPLGCVATIRIENRYNLRNVPLSRTPLVVVTEAIEKPGNLGVISRSASAAGADALIVADGRTDIFDPGCVHASLGSVFDLPNVTTTSAECLAWLRENGMSVLATTPHAELSYYEQDMTGPVAVVIGNEHFGLSREWLDASIPVRIDMVGPMNSLNASVTSAVVLFEAVRQRRTAGSAKGGT